jgi:hypothetical protein
MNLGKNFFYFFCVFYELNATNFGNFIFLVFKSRKNLKNSFFYPKDKNMK